MSVYKLMASYVIVNVEQIRMKDIPERMQLRSVPVTKVAKDSPELEEEAEWIYKQAFCRPTISKQVKYLSYN
jgi:transcription elongation factor SPT6